MNKAKSTILSNKYSFIFISEFLSTVPKWLTKNDSIFTHLGMKDTDDNMEDDNLLSLNEYYVLVWFVFFSSEGTKGND